MRKAHEFSEAAALLSKGTPILGFKYRLARARTQRKLGDYLDALEAMATLEKEIAETMDKAADESPERRKLAALLVRLLRERMTVLCIRKKYHLAEAQF